jgi:hypothetical protein
MMTTGPDATVTIPEITVRLAPNTITVPTTVSAPAPPPSQHGMTAAEADAAGDRNDFIKRLFAVAVSVGFATTAPSTLQWMVTFALPDRAAARSSALLLASLLLVVQSWEGYLASVRNYPLKDRMRFYIDITLVFEYLLLLHLSVDDFHDPQHYQFMICICTIFFTYLVWDYYRILAYRSTYAVKSWADAFVPFVWGFFKKDAVYKGPSITLWWLAYFLIIHQLSDFTAGLKFFVMLCAIIYGLSMYRFDKTRRFGIITKVISAFIPIAILISMRFICRACASLCDVSWF